MFTNIQKNASICTPSGLDCYEKISINESTCIKPCLGLFADIGHEVHNEAPFESLVSQYEDYKRGWTSDVNFPQQISGESNDLLCFQICDI